MSNTKELKEYARRFIAWCWPKSLKEFIEVAAALGVTAIFIRGLLPNALGALQPLLPLFALAFFTFALWAIVLVQRLFFLSQPEAPRAPKPRPDVWLRDAVFYCVLRKWLGDGEQLELKGAQHQQAADYLKEIRQLARNGDLIIWGKRWENSTHDPLPADYWAHHEVEYLELHRDSAQDVRTDSATPEGKDGDSYKSLRVNKWQFEQQWPPTKKP